MAILDKAERVASLPGERGRSVEGGHLHLSSSMCRYNVISFPSTYFSMLPFV